MGQRPSGVVVLVVLEALAALVSFGLGILMVILAGFIALRGLPEIPAYFGGLIAAAIGMVLILIGVISFGVAYGFWNGLGWSWNLGVAISALGLIISLVALPFGIIGLLLYFSILCYLTRPHVKRYFGKKPVQLTI